MQNPVILANHLYHVGAAQTQDLRDFLLATLGSQTGFKFRQEILGEKLRKELPNASLIDLLTYERGRIATICLVVGETKERTKEITPGKALFEMQPAYKKLL